MFVLVSALLCRTRLLRSTDVANNAWRRHDVGN